MNRLLYILLCATLLTFASCTNVSNVDSSSNTASDEKGVLKLNVSSRTSTTLPDFTLCIYQISSEKSMLVRKYTSGDEIPEYIWLLAGDYTATIESGTAVAASFDNAYYYGESDFKVVAGETIKVDLVAVLQNIPVEVIFDQTIKEGCVVDGVKAYKVEVFATNDLSSTNDSTPQLEYTEDKVGYFVMPEEVTTLSWRFTGTYRYADNGETVSLDKSGKIENVESKKHYKLSFKYSPDSNGFLGEGLSVVLDTTVDERDDHFAFSPDPELKGVGFDLAVPYNYAGGERKYVATSPANFTTVRLTIGEKVFTPSESAVDGISLSGLNTPQLYITLSEKFFNTLSGGAQNIEMFLADKDGGEVTSVLPYNLQGVNAYNKAGTNLWAGTAALSATIFGAPSLVQITLREGEGEWKMFDAASSGANTYTAQVDGLGAGRSYEYNLLIDGKTVGTSLSFSTEQGVQIPNGDLEDWCENGDGVIIPWASGSNPYWCSGNYGTAILSKNITKSSSDVRPGSPGTKSAYMDSEYIVIKFAAGNVYIGAWGGMDGTNAKVYFGQPFTFNAKPKAIRFWAKFNCGKINKIKTGKAKEGDPDLAKIFCCMCDWTAPHLVDSSKGDKTTFSPSDADIKSGDARYNGVLYSAYMDTTTSQTEWKEFEIPFSFYGDDPTKVPNYLVLTFTCSGYGDFFDGSTDSWMYIDDIEFVY